MLALRANAQQNRAKADVIAKISAISPKNAARYAT
jgi:hypothetical protein